MVQKKVYRRQIYLNLFSLWGESSQLMLILNKKKCCKAVYSQPSPAQNSWSWWLGGPEKGWPSKLFYTACFPIPLGLHITKQLISWGNIYNFLFRYRKEIKGEKWPKYKNCHNTIKIKILIDFKGLYYVLSKVRENKVPLEFLFSHKSLFLGTFMILVQTPKNGPKHIFYF